MQSSPLDCAAGGPTESEPASLGAGAGFSCAGVPEITTDRRMAPSVDSAVPQSSPELDKALGILLRREIDPARQGIASPAPDPLDELPGAAAVSAEQARASVAEWLRSGMPLFGLHQIAIALDREVERLRTYAAFACRHHVEVVADLDRLRAIEAAARDAYGCLKLAGAQYTPQGKRLAEVLKIKHEPQAPEDNDAA
jgi:hypothetical protein